MPNIVGQSLLAQSSFQPSEIG